MKIKICVALNYSDSYIFHRVILFYIYEVPFLRHHQPLSCFCEAKTSHSISCSGDVCFEYEFD